MQREKVVGGALGPELMRFREAVRRAEYHEGYCITPRREIYLGKSIPRNHCGDLLVLELPSAGEKTIRERGVSSLDYIIREGYIDINFIQPPSRGNPNAAKTVLGESPHELLLKRFLVKVSGYLDSHPETRVRFDPLGRYRSGNPELYGALRDRFFSEDKDGTWSLSAEKRRVVEALGCDNRWITSRSGKG